MIAKGDPGAPQIPDIFTGYPKIGIQFHEKDMIVNLDDYFTEEELNGYVDAFIKEGRFGDNGLYLQVFYTMVIRSLMMTVRLKTLSTAFYHIRYLKEAAKQRFSEAAD